MDKILFERKEYHKDKIEDTGGIKVFFNSTYCYYCGISIYDVI